MELVSSGSFLYVAILLWLKATQRPSYYRSSRRTSNYETYLFFKWEICILNNKSIAFKANKHSIFGEISLEFKW